MKIKSIKLNMHEYGPSIGAIFIDLRFTKQEKNEESANIFAELEKELSKESIDSLLSGTLSLRFSGDYDIVEDREEITEFLRGVLSEKSLEYQTHVLKRRPDQMRPPFIELKTMGNTYTATEHFYELFNVVVCIPPKYKDVNAFALTEIHTHAFSCFILDGSDLSEVDSYVELFSRTSGGVPKNLTYYVNPPKEEKLYQECKQYAFDKNIRLLLNTNYGGSDDI